MKRSCIAWLCMLAGCVANSAPSPPLPWALDWPAARWEPLHERRSVSLRGLSVVDGRTVWATGSGGTVLRTVDGGRTWQDVPPKDTQTCDFRDVHAFDGNAAVVMVAGQPARLYRTADGGASWTIVHEDPRPEAFFDSIAFSGDCGVMFGDPVGGAFTVLRSDDRGVTWAAVDRGALPEPVSAEAGFAASGTCVCAAMGRPPLGFVAWIATGGNASRCLRSDDLGASWRSAALPLVQGGPSQGAFSIAFRNLMQGVAVGGDYREPLRADGTAAWTNDGGQTWRACVGGAGGYRSCAVWLDRDHVLAVGERSASLSRDCGQTWRPFGELGFHAAAGGGDAVFACGSDGRIAQLLAERRR